MGPHLYLIRPAAGSRIGKHEVYQRRLGWLERSVLAVSAAREGIDPYINFYNTRRPHSSHQARTPDVVHFASLHQPSAGAA